MCRDMLGWLGLNRLRCLINKAEQIPESTLKTVFQLHHHLQHFHNQITASAIREFMLLRTCVQDSDPRQMEESGRTSRHVTVWTGMQQREGSVLDEEEEEGARETSVSTFLNPFLSPPSSFSSSHGRQQPGRDQRD